MKQAEAIAADEGSAERPQLSEQLSSLRLAREQREPPTTSRGRILPYLALAALSALAAMGYLYRGALLAPRVKLGTISFPTASTGATLQTSGHMVARNGAQVSAPVLGRVASLQVARGQHVEAGQLLLELEHDEFAPRLAVARARVAAARAHRASALAELRQAKERAAREEAFARQGAAAYAEVSSLQSRAEVMERTLGAAAAEVSASVAEVTALEQQQERSKIRAPVAGTLLSEPPHLGELFGNGNKVLELADFSSIVFESEIPEAQLSRLPVGSKCEVTLDALPGHGVPCELETIAPQVNRAKATLGLTARLLGDRSGILPNMAGRATFRLEPAGDRAVARVPLVPNQALVVHDGQHYVFVHHDGHVERAAVRVGKSGAQGTELQQGPAPGTEVVLDPPASLRHGEDVRVES